jgi:Uncharacterized protein conserved in bacteria
MSLATVLLPVFVQVFLTFFLGIWMGKERMQAARAGQIDGKDAALYPVRWPEKAQLVSNSFHNQLELPPLFYVLVILALITQKADWLFVLMSWVFVISRIAHAAVHTTSNKMSWRGQAFLIGVFVLMAMWLILAIRVLLF